ncbi:uncharacterized protein LOC110007289 [Amborella trichopoda]|uniref:uncharacterized protein LOC110007289 n=1 Tax=Amborella trichopoda TaxID=13333 RepID=UPI0009BF2903|nr:uncharacterized protein LOC110007289 [Amborella trichopoda]|eukprot:XP_020523023.1 uncharacterized protein LOC110007289 [Amborella trichopoda]
MVIEVIPLIMVIESDGDVIDCIDIYEQPAFDHPLLKNHIIQSDGDVIDCVDIYKQPAFDHPLLKNHTIQYAGMFASKKDFYGAIQAVSAWTPQVEVPTEFSAASTWLVNNEGTETNVVGAGWMVNPSLFGDNLTRLFVSWNKVGSQTTGCYNLFCSGFIQTDKNVVLGAYLKPITVPGGTEYFLHYNIIKDKNTGNWWFSAENLSIGYWPASMFTNLQVAQRVVWAGQVLNTKPGGHHTATKMGNGIFPDEKQEAAIFKDLEVVDADGNGQLDLIDIHEAELMAVKEGFLKLQEDHVRVIIEGDSANGTGDITYGFLRLFYYPLALESKAEELVLAMKMQLKPSM